MTSDQALAQEFEKLKDLLIKKYDEKGMRASGAWAKELEARSVGLSASIWGLPYSEQLENGRGPTSSGAKSGTITLRQAIEQWIEDKGIRPEGKMTVSSLAFLIARKIHRQGWDRKNYGGVDLISEVITPEYIQGVLDLVTYFKINEFSTEITNLFKQAAAA